ncbi:hypothetical protein LXL04_035011 [Taraxacum kok-saghyz]
MKSRRSSLNISLIDANMEELLDFAAKWGNCPKRRKLFLFLIYGLVWCTWKERNMKVFNNLHLTPIMIADDVLSCTYLWFKYKGQERDQAVRYDGIFTFFLTLLFASNNLGIFSFAEVATEQFHGNDAKIWDVEIHIMMKEGAHRVFVEMPKRRHGSLASVYLHQGMAVVELEFQHLNYVSKAEKSWKLITSSLYSALHWGVMSRSE